MKTIKVNITATLMSDSERIFKGETHEAEIKPTTKGALQAAKELTNIPNLELGDEDDGIWLFFAPIDANEMTDAVDTFWAVWVIDENNEAQVE